MNMSVIKTVFLYAFLFYLFFSFTVLLYNITAELKTLVYYEIKLESEKKSISKFHLIGVQREIQTVYKIFR